jgi:ribosomal protein L7/L12
VVTLNPEELVREQLADGKSLDEVAVSLIEHRFGPVTAIKAMRTVTGKGLDELKQAVDRALPPSEQAKNDALRQAAMELLMKTDPEGHD